MEEAVFFEIQHLQFQQECPSFHGISIMLFRLQKANHQVMNVMVNH